MTIEKILEHIGLGANEIKVYRYLLEKKKAAVTNIAEYTRINRTTTYDILNSLYSKGLLMKYSENKKIAFGVDSPKRLFQWLKRQDENIQERLTTLQTHFEQITSVFRAGSNSPQVQYFEGNGRIEEFFNDSLLCRPDEIVGYSNAQTIFQNFDERYCKQYSKSRCTKNIAGRYIVKHSDSEATHAYLKKYYAKLLSVRPGLIQCRSLPLNHAEQVISETIIYSDRVAISNLDKKFFGVIINSNDVARTQKTIFEALWKTLTNKINL